MNNSIKQRFFRYALGVLLWIGTSMVLIPVALLLITSLKSTKEAQIIEITLPSVWYFENYAVVWEKGNILQGLFNSVVITVPCVALIIFASALMSYYLARKRSRMAFGIYAFVIAGLTKPISLVTTFLLLQQLKIINTRTGVILVLAGCLMSLSTFIYVGFIKGIPRELDDASAIDGGGPFRTFWQIVFPLLKPCTSTVLILMVLNVWNDGQAGLFFLGDNRLWTMPLNIYRFYGYYRMEWNYIFGCIFLTTLPVFITYIFCQRYIIEGMVSGSIKG